MSPELNCRYLEILKNARVKDLDSCINLLIAAGLNTENHISLIAEVISVYLRDIIVRRLEVTPTRTFVDKLCEALNGFPEECIIECLELLAFDGLLVFSDDRDYVVWKKLDPIPNTWKHIISKLIPYIMRVLNAHGGSKA